MATINATDVNIQGLAYISFAATRQGDKKYHRPSGDGFRRLATNVNAQWLNYIEFYGSRRRPGDPGYGQGNPANTVSAPDIWVF